MSTSFQKKYRVICKIGEGTFSEVLKCQDRITGNYYAGKRLKKIYYSENEILKSSEIIAMKKLTRHPNVLYMIESHHDPLPGKLMLIYDLMDMTLYDFIHKRKNRVISEHRVRKYLHQLLKGLQHLHKHGIFHRDIKPENILLKGDVVKLGDLGCIRGMYCEPPYTEYISTRWYRSPECLLTSGYYGPKMDIWAIGCVFYELLTLKPLFPGGSEIDQIAKIHTILGTPNLKILTKFLQRKSRSCSYAFPIKEGIGLSNLLPHVTETGKEILKLMLAYDPRNRYSVKKLLDHKYFNNLNTYCTPRYTSTLTLPLISTNCRHQLRDSVYSLHNQGILKNEDIKLPNIAASRPKFRSEFCNNKTSKTETNVVSIRDACNPLQKSWKTHTICSHSNGRVNDAKLNSNNLKLPLINCNRMKIPQIHDVEMEYTPKHMLTPLASQCKLHPNNLHQTFKPKLSDKIISDKISSKKSHGHFHRSTTLSPTIYKSDKCRYPPPTISNSIKSVQLTSKNVEKHDEKRKNRLNSITELHLGLPSTRTSNVKNLGKKMVKHDVTSKSMGKMLLVKKNASQHLHGRDKF